MSIEHLYREKVLEIVSEKFEHVICEALKPSSTSIESYIKQNFYSIYVTINNFKIIAIVVDFERNKYKIKINSFGIDTYICRDIDNIDKLTDYTNEKILLDSYFNVYYGLNFGIEEIYKAFTLFNEYMYCNADEELDLSEKFSFFSFCFYGFCKVPSISVNLPERCNAIDGYQFRYLDAY